MSKVQQAILSISKHDIRMAFKDQLKKLDIPEVEVATEIEACMPLLQKWDRALLVVDWNTRPEEASHILDAAQTDFPAATRPIMLITTQPVDNLLKIASDYNVLRIHSGEISPTAIQEHLEHINSYEMDISGISQNLKEISNLQEKGETQKALELIQENLDRHPNQPRMLGELVNTYIVSDDWGKASTSARVFVDAHPENNRARNLMGRCLMHEGKHSDAIEHFKIANSINPYKVDRLLDLGDALMTTGDHAEAEKHFEQALSVDKKNKKAVEGKTTCLLLDENINEALSLLKKTSSMKELASIFNNAAIISVGKNETDKAINLYKSGISLSELDSLSRGKLYFNLGVAYYKQKELQLALSCFENACEEDSSLKNAEINAQILSSQLNKETPEGPDLDKMIDQFGDDFEDESI